MLSSLIPTFAFALLSRTQGERDFTFTLCETTRKHIAIQPRGDYDRIHFVVRIQNLKGKRAFARVRCEPLADAEKRVSLTTQIINIESNNDLWSLYLRVPRFEKTIATYQVEIGEFLSQEVNDFDVQTSFAWQSHPQSRPRYFHNLPDGGVVSMEYEIKIPVVTKEGTVIVRYGAAVPTAAVALTWGEDHSEDMKEIDGSYVARKLN